MTVLHSQKGFEILSLSAFDLQTLKLQGDASLATEEIGKALSLIHESAVKQGIRSIVVDVRDLTFMNSAGFKSFVTWLSRVMALPEEQRYKIRVLSNPETYWQARSFDALRSFAVDVLDVVSGP